MKYYYYHTTIKHSCDVQFLFNKIRDSAVRGNKANKYDNAYVFTLLIILALSLTDGTGYLTLIALVNVCLWFWPPNRTVDGSIVNIA